MTPNSLRYFLFILFALSGFSGLIYESIWTHYLKLFLGHAAYAQTLVLAIFMGGMALGSWVCSRYSTKWRNLILGYAFAEALIGVLALLFHDAFQLGLHFSYTAVIPSLDSVAAISIYKWSLASLYVLPQSILLGMTFPLMSAGIIRRFPANPGSTVSMLYFTNSMGGAIGVLVSGFFLINAVGLPGTILAAGCINIILAGTVWVLIKSQAEPAFKFTIEQDNNSRNSQTEVQQTSIYKIVLLATALFTGLASFVYEIGWIRMLSMVLGSSTHAFELMLSAFIFGLAVGGLWIRRRIDHIKDTVRFLALVQLLMGIFALSTLLSYGNAFSVMEWLISSLEKTEQGYNLFNVSSHVIVLVVMLPATFCAGTTLPLITYSLLKKGYGEQSIGAVYGINTVGAIIGIFLTIHLLMPELGLKGVLVFGAVVDITLGLVLLWWRSQFRFKLLPVASTAIGVSLIAIVIFWVQLDSLKMSSAVYRTAKMLNPAKASVLQHQDGKTATIDLTEHGQDFVAIRTNGKPDASINMTSGTPTFDEATMTLAAAIPLMMYPQAKTAANIGMGSGLTTHSLLTTPILERVDTIEIERAMVDVAQGFRPRNELAYTDPRSKIYIEDAKTFFSSHNRVYDIIISEPSNPWVSGTASLFTQEFYQLITRHLSTQGLLVQWLQLYEINMELVVSILKSLTQHFDDFVIYASNAGDILIVAKNNGPIPSLDQRLFRYPQFANELSRLKFNNVQDIEFRRIANKKLLTAIIDSYRVQANSDYYPIVGQNAPRERFLNSNAAELLSISQESIPVLETLNAYRPIWTDTEITANKAFPYSTNAYMATKMRDYLLGKSLMNVSAANRRYVIKKASEFKALFANCGLAPSHGDRVFVLLELGLKLVSYLRPNELHLIWQHLNVQSCKTQWTEIESSWLELVIAVGERNAEKMQVLAEKLLIQDKNTTAARQKYLVAVAMLGNLAQGKKQRALALWDNYGGDLFVDKEPLMMFRMLIENSKTS